MWTFSVLLASLLTPTLACAPKPSPEISPTSSNDASAIAPEVAVDTF